MRLCHMLDIGECGFGAVDRHATAPGKERGYFRLGEVSLEFWQLPLFQHPRTIRFGLGRQHLGIRRLEVSEIEPG